MKRKLPLLFIILLSAFIAGAQITITSADFPSLGNLVVRAVDNTTSVSPGSAGTGQVWDLSNLTASSYDSCYFISPAGLPYSQNYPQATMAMSTNPMLPNYQYDFSKPQTDGNIYYGVEAYAVIFGDFVMAIHCSYTNEPVSLPLPFTYGDVDYQDYTFTMTTVTRNAGVMVDSSKNVSTVNMTMAGDASGTMILPDGSFPVIRVKETLNMHDSSFRWSGSNWGFESDTIYSYDQYRWYANDYGEVGYLYDDSKKGPSFDFFKSETIVGINDKKQESFTVYPNPANKEINVRSANSNVWSEIFGLNGQLLITGGDRLDISSFATGTYIIKVHTPQGTASSRFTKE